MVDPSLYRMFFENQGLFAKEYVTLDANPFAVNALSPSSHG